MPPLLSQRQMELEVENRAMPLLDALTANRNLRTPSLWGFEGDDPPSYLSSTELELFDKVDKESRPRLRTWDELPEELRAVMDQPISDLEVEDIVSNSSMITILRPGDFYFTVAEIESDRLSMHRAKMRRELEASGRFGCLGVFEDTEGWRRHGVVVRHNIKRRWEKIGVWNPEWGFPGRKSQFNDKAYKWRWRWQQQKADDSEDDEHRGDYSMVIGAKQLLDKQLLTRTLERRQKLRRGESAPVFPTVSPQTGRECVPSRVISHEQALVHLSDRARRRSLEVSSPF